MQSTSLRKVVHAMTSRSIASVIARRAKGSRDPPLSLNPPNSTDHPVGIPIARGRSSGLYLNECVRMIALPAPFRGCFTASTTLSLKTNTVLAYSGWRIVCSKSPSHLFPTKGTPARVIIFFFRGFFSSVFGRFSFRAYAAEQAAARCMYGALPHDMGWGRPCPMRHALLCGIG